MVHTFGDSDKSTISRIASRMRLLCITKPSLEKIINPSKRIVLCEATKPVRTCPAEEKCGKTRRYS